MASKSQLGPTASAETQWPDLLVPALAAAAWSVLIAGAASDGIDVQRGIVFAGGPLVLLAGLHARLTDFLHARARIESLPLPVPATRHWDAALPRHGRGLAATGIVGGLAIAAAALVSPTPEPMRTGALLILDWLWLCLAASLVEPAIGAVSAALGRRFPEDSRWYAAQRSLGGGWTAPEAVIHLYAPALGIGLATVLAMPGQLLFARLAAGASATSTLIAVAAGPVVFAVLVRASAPRLYRGSLWEAVPWLVEATRTLAGPARPERAAAWIEQIRDPVRRVLVTQHQRLTPLPLVRLGLMIVCAAILIIRSTPPSLPALAVFACLIGLWWVPALAVVRARPALSRMLAPLPLAEPARRGSDWGFIAALVVPPVVAAGLVLIRYSVPS